jgi:hypothetical protein
MFLESRGAASLGQGVHRVTHRVHGASDLLVVPVVHDQMRIQNSDMQRLTVYQITFTRAISA